MRDRLLRNMLVRFREKNGRRETMKEKMTMKKYVAALSDEAVRHLLKVKPCF